MKFWRSTAVSDDAGKELHAPLHTVHDNIAELRFHEPRQLDGAIHGPALANAAFHLKNDHIVLLVSTGRPS